MFVCRRPACPCYLRGVFTNAWSLGNLGQRDALTLLSPGSQAGDTRKGCRETNLPSFSFFCCCCCCCCCLLGEGGVLLFTLFLKRYKIMFSKQIFLCLGFVCLFVCLFLVLLVFALLFRDIKLCSSYYFFLFLLSFFLAVL